MADAAPLLTRWQYLFAAAVLDGANIWLAREAVASVAVAHPEWDLTEQRTWDGWRSGAGLTVILPGLTAGRDFADDIVTALGDITGRPVTVDARGMVSSTAKFTDQLLLRLAAASSITVVSGGADFQRWAAETAEGVGIGGKMRLMPDDTP